MRTLSKQNVTHIFHIADLHIRKGDYNKARIEEYKTVFNAFLSKIGEHESIKNGTGLIIIAGDIFHDKYRIESEGLLLFIEFINKAIELAPIIIICGNHDYLQDSPDATDLIESVIGAFKNQRIYYLSETGQYRYGPIGIGLVSIKDTLRTTAKSGIVDELPPFPSPDKFGTKVTRKIALFHGSISQSALPNECSILGGYPLEWFTGYDFGIFGDNHKQQLHRSGSLTWGYPGSLVQQDDGEPTFGHGYILWDIAAGTAECHHIYNPFGSITVRKNKNKEYEIRLGHKEILTNPKDIMTKAHFPETPKIRYVGPTEELSEIQSWFSVKGIHASSVYSRTVGKSVFPDEAEESTPNVEQFIDLNQKEKWIEYIIANDAPDLVKYIEKENSVLISNEYDVYCADVRERNKILQKLLESYTESIETQKSKRHIIIFKNMRWDYLMSYGENNHFNFSMNNGHITLINGPNASGKSGFLDIICIAIFGQQTTNRRMVETGKKETIYVINDKKPYGKKANVSLLVEIDGQDYEIYRAFNKNHKQESLIVCYEFTIFKITEDRKIVIAEKTKAGDWINAHFGGISELLMSTILCQTDIDNFFMKPVKKQIELIDSALNMDSITRYQDLLKESINAHKYIIKTLNDRVIGMGESYSVAVPENIDLEATRTLLATAQEKEDKYSKRATDYLVRIGDVNEINKKNLQSQEALERALERSQETLDTFADITEDDKTAAWTFKGRYEVELPELIREMKKYQGAAAAFKGDIPTELPEQPDKPQLSIDNIKEHIKSYKAWAKCQPSEWMEDIDSLDNYKENLTNEISSLKEYLRENMMLKPPSSRPSPGKIPKKRPEGPLWSDSKFNDYKYQTVTINIDAKIAKEQYNKIRDINSVTPSTVPIDDFDSTYEKYMELKDTDRISGDYKKWEREYLLWSKKVESVSDKSSDELRKILKNTQKVNEYKKEQARVLENIELIEKELATIADFPYNAECWACQKNPTHILCQTKRAQCDKLRSELDKIAKYLRKHDNGIEITQDALELRIYYENTYEKMNSEKSAWDIENQIRALESALVGHAHALRAVLYQEEAVRRKKWARWIWNQWDTYESKKSEFDIKTNELYKLESFIKEYEWRAGNYEEALKEKDKAERYTKWEQIVHAREYYAIKEKAIALEKEYDDNKNLFKRLEECANCRAQIAKYQKEIYYHRWCAINEELLKLRNTIQEYKKQIYSAEAAIEAHKKHTQKTGAYKSAIESLKTRLDELTRLSNLFGGASGTGYKAYIYSNQITGLIEYEVNRFLETIDNFRFKISYTGGAFDYHLIDRGNKPSLDNASGYQKFVVGLGMRMALSRIGSVGNNIKHLFIDEGFVSFDANNLEKSADIMRTLMCIGQYKSIYIVSHLETIKQMAEAQVTIQRPKESASILRYGAGYPCFMK